MISTSAGPKDLKASDVVSNARKIYSNTLGSFNRFQLGKKIGFKPYLGGVEVQNIRTAANGWVDPGGDFTICEDAMIAFELDPVYAELDYNVRSLASALTLHKIHTARGQIYCGSMAAAALFWFDEKKYYIDVANVGDSEVLLSIRNKKTSVKEFRRLNTKHQEGIYFTRSIGDKDRRGKIIGHDCDFFPYAFDISEDEEVDLIVACDGLTERMAENEIEGLIVPVLEKHDKEPPQDIADNLQVLARAPTPQYSHRSHDDISITVIKISQAIRLTKQLPPEQRKKIVDGVAVFDGHFCGRGYIPTINKLVQKNPVSEGLALYFFPVLTSVLNALDYLYETLIKTDKFDTTKDEVLDEHFKYIFTQTAISPPEEHKRTLKSDKTVDLRLLQKFKAIFEKKRIEAEALAREARRNAEAEARAKYLKEQEEQRQREERERLQWLKELEEQRKREAAAEAERQRLQRMREIEEQRVREAAEAERQRKIALQRAAIEKAYAEALERERIAKEQAAAAEQKRMAVEKLKYKTDVLDCLIKTGKKFQPNNSIFSKIDSKMPADSQVSRVRFSDIYQGIKSLRTHLTTSAVGPELGLYGNQGILEGVILRVCTAKELIEAISKAREKYIDPNAEISFWRRRNPTKANDLVKAITELECPSEIFQNIYNYLKKGEGSWHADSFKQLIVNELRQISFMPFDRWSDYLCTPHIHAPSADYKY